MNFHGRCLQKVQHERRQVFPLEFASDSDESRLSAAPLKHHLLPNFELTRVVLLTSLKYGEITYQIVGSDWYPLFTRSHYHLAQTGPEISVS